MLKDFYKGKKVFITGGTGFKGAWLCLLLKKLGAEIFDYSLAPPSNPSLWELADVKSVCTHIRADILNKSYLKEQVMAVQPDILVHMAAQSLVRPSYESPYETLNINIMGTASVLEAVLACNSIKSTLIITSDKAYENIGKQYPYTEKDRMGGHDPYSASKGAAELVIHSYRKSFFDLTKQGIASVRAGNVIGGGDFAKDRLIPDMARSFNKGTLVELRYPNATRPWQHVLDPLYGYLLLAKELFNEPQAYSEGWNFGPLNNEAHTVEEVVQHFTKKWNNISHKPTDMKSFTISQQQHLYEAAFLGLDCTKAYTKLSWLPRLTFTESIDLTAIWYRAWSMEKTNLINLCVQQISDFLRKNNDIP